MQCRRGAVVAAGLAAAAVVGATLLLLLQEGPCGGSAFRCGNTSQCVPHHFVCNSHQDCPEAEDEDLLMCSNTEGWKPIQKVVRNTGVGPDFEKCEVTGWNATWPMGCSCRNLTWVFCTHLGLTEVPPPPPPPPSPTAKGRAPERLILDGNAIRSLGKDSLEGYNLHLLRIVHSGLEHIAPQALRSQRNLVKLQLSDNALSAPLSLQLLKRQKRLLWFFVARNAISRLPLEVLKPLRELEWLDLSDNRLTLEGEVFPELPKLNMLNLHGNAIVSLGSYQLPSLPALQQLTLQNNKLTTLDPQTFARLPTLHFLNLTNNRLEELESNTLSNLSNLAYLSLAWNPLVFVPRSLISPLSNLTSLNLEGLELDQFDVRIFRDLPRLRHLCLHRFHFCSYAPRVTSCRPNTDGVSSSEHLLARPAQRAAVWALAVAALAGNLLVLGGRAAARDDSPGLSAAIRNLAAADLLMGVYLCVVGTRDVQLRGHYSSHALRWMASWECTLAGAAAMLSSEVSMLVLLLISLERFLLIAWPLRNTGQPGLTPGLARRALAAIWLAGALLAGLPAYHWRHSNRFYGTSGLCFPLHIEDPFLQGWQYSTFIILGVNAPGVLLMGALYACLFVSVWRTRRRTRAESRRSVGFGGVGAGPSERELELELAVRFLLLVLTDAACWAPVAALKLIALAKGTVPADVYAWVVVFILPVNSALNPLLYTFSTPRYRARLYVLLRRAGAVLGHGGSAGAASGGGGGGGDGRGDGARGGRALLASTAAPTLTAPPSSVNGLQRRPSTVAETDCSCRTGQRRSEESEKALLPPDILETAA